MKFIGQAFMKCLTELRRLFCFLKPSKCEADLEFGFSDPSVTGYVLAGASLIYPFIGECVEITPNFDEKVLKGKAMIKGRVHAVYFVIVLWNLLWNKISARRFPISENYAFRIQPKSQRRKTANGRE